MDNNASNLPVDNNMLVAHNMVEHSSNDYNSYSMAVYNNNYNFLPQLETGFVRFYYTPAV